MLAELTENAPAYILLPLIKSSKIFRDFVIAFGLRKATTENMLCYIKFMDEIT